MFLIETFQDGEQQLTETLKRIKVQIIACSLSSLSILVKEHVGFENNFYYFSLALNFYAPRSRYYNFDFVLL
jgi:hypothetical protein